MPASFENDYFYGAKRSRTGPIGALGDMLPVHSSEVTFLTGGQETHVEPARSVDLDPSQTQGELTFAYWTQQEAIEAYATNAEIQVHDIPPSSRP